MVQRGMAQALTWLRLRYRSRIRRLDPSGDLRVRSCRRVLREGALAAGGKRDRAQST